MDGIKQRRLQQTLTSYPNLHVGDCVPFYFCPRSVMLYLISKANDPDLSYRGGQEPIVHLEADLYSSVNWANENNKRWVFTLSNAGSFYFEDRCNLEQLSEIKWDDVQATQWKSCIAGKQAEFLMEQAFPWHLIERIGVYSLEVYHQAVKVLPMGVHPPKVEIKKEWYY